MQPIPSLSKPFAHRLTDILARRGLNVTEDQVAHGVGSVVTHSLTTERAQAVGSLLGPLHLTEASRARLGEAVDVSVTPGASPAQIDTALKLFDHASKGTFGANGPQVAWQIEHQHESR